MRDKAELKKDWQKSSELLTDYLDGIPFTRTQRVKINHLLGLLEITFDRALAIKSE